MFCMLLRKYLAGGKILARRQPPMERLAELVVEAANEMGDKVRRRLVLEAMGRRTNLLLLDGEDRIVDCLRRVEGDLTLSLIPISVIFYHSGKALSSAFPENDNGICTFSGKTRKNQPSFAALTLMPGPMVEATTQLLI